MKTISILTIAMALFCLSCGDQKKAQDAEPEVDMKEIQSLDSLASQAENVTDEIKESADNLDAILEDL